MISSALTDNFPISTNKTTIPYIKQTDMMVSIIVVIILSTFHVQKYG